MADGRVTITGRAKEVIIVNGVHHYCHEIEDVLGTLDGVAAGFVAAFGVPVPEGTSAGRGVRARRPADAATVRGVRRWLVERFGAALGAARRPSTSSRFDQTTSGKIQRGGMRARLLPAANWSASRARSNSLEAGPATCPTACTAVSGGPAGSPRPVHPSACW